MKTQKLKWHISNVPYLVVLVSLLLGFPGFAAGSSTELSQTGNITPDGFHDGAAGVISDPGECTAFGWAVDPDDRSVDVPVRVFVDDTVEPVASRLANDYGTDMDELRICPEGTCRFTVNLWNLISPDEEHTVYVQAQDIDTGEWLDLMDTPRQLICTTPPEPNPFIWADRFAEYVNGWDWPSSATIDLQIFLGEVLLHTDVQGSDETGAVGFDLNSHGFNLEPGHRVVMATEGISKELIVTNLSLASYDVIEKTISGERDPSFGFWIHVEGREPDSVSFVDEEWIAIFGELYNQDCGEVAQPDEDGDMTGFGFCIPQPHFSVFPLQEVVEGWEWAMGETVHLSINSGEFGTDGVVEPAEWDPTMPWLWIDFSGDFDVDPGDVVALSGSSGTAVHTVEFLTITEKDVVENIVAGYSDPFEEIRLWPHYWHEPLFTQADTKGYWVADLDDIGFDLEYYVNVRASIVDPYGNETAIDFWAVPPVDGGHDGAQGVVSKSECAAFGWASDPDEPERVVDIQILADGIPVASTYTESNDYYVDLWELIDPMKAHWVSVQAYDVEGDAWFDLNGTPRQMLCTGLPQGGNVSIVVETHLNPEEDSPFTAYGPAVDEGLICPSGLVSDSEPKFSGPPDGSILNIHVEKLFTCDDGSGTFTLQLQVHVEFDPYKDLASWRVIGGTDAYSGLKGNGKLAGVPADYGVIDYYGGMLSIR